MVNYFEFMAFITWLKIIYDILIIKFKLFINNYFYIHYNFLYLYII